MLLLYHPRALSHMRSVRHDVLHLPYFRAVLVFSRNLALRAPPESGQTDRLGYEETEEREVVRLMDILISHILVGLHDHPPSLYVTFV